MEIKDLFIKLCGSLIQKFNGTKIFAVAKDYFKYLSQKRTLTGNFCS